jgi:subtilase family serine protease
LASDLFNFYVKDPSMKRCSWAAMLAGVLLSACGQNGAPDLAAPVPSASLSYQTLGHVLPAPRLGQGVYSYSFHDAALPSAAQSLVTVYTPAQIRQLYDLPPLATATPEQLGAGATIYIVSAYNAPNVLSDLATFNAHFGLPACTTISIPTAAALPPANKSRCEIAVANTTFAAAITQTPPIYNASWAQETTLDVQWAHATAPLARIVVLQALNTFVNSFADSLMVAAKLGPGVVSMSWVAAEAPFVENYETFLKAPGTTYVAAAGDYGSQANWPATSPQVIAVGGTTLAVANGQRKETVWSRSGGGFSLYFQQPDYQASTITSGPVTARYSPTPGVLARGSVDLSWDADPYTGVYVVWTDVGKSAAWYSFGGTSIGSPQIAGLIETANARRAALGKAAVGKISPLLYSSLGKGVGAAGGSFSDITQGGNGSCSYCSARPGWDSPTGWGTPNGSVFVDALVAQP